ncbi:MAG: NAD(P)H-dependent oxidoreductase subunit E [Gemmatimonadota bacterium]
MSAGPGVAPLPEREAVAGGPKGGEPGPAERIGLPAGLAQEVECLLECHGQAGGAILPALEALERALGSIPDGAFLAAGRLLGVRPADLKELAVASGRFAVERAPAHTLVVCVHRHCAARGAAGLLRALEAGIGLRAGERLPGGRLALETTRCLGACKLGPNVLLDGACYHAVTPEGLLRILRPLGPRRSPAASRGPAEATPVPCP